MALSLASCEADHVAARVVLQEWGLHGVSIFAAPTFGRPCRYGEPFAVRFRAVREDGVILVGTLCARDEGADDSRLLLDGPGARP